MGSRRLKATLAIPDGLSLPSFLPETVVQVGQDGFSPLQELGNYMRVAKSPSGPFCSTENEKRRFRFPHRTTICYTNHCSGHPPWGAWITRKGRKKSKRAFLLHGKRKASFPFSSQNNHLLCKSLFWAPPRGAVMTFSKSSTLARRVSPYRGGIGVVTRI